MAGARKMVFLSAALATFMVSVEATIVATAIPTIVGDLGDLRLFSWVFGIYFLTQAVTIPVYGRLADIYGRKLTLSVAVAVFLTGSILCGFAHTMLELILFRALQGLGAGGVQPIASTIVGDLYPGKERARVQSILSSTWGISAVIGPLLGAFLIERAGWPAIFWVNVPFGVLCVVVVWRYLVEKIERRGHRIDYLGSVLLALSIGLLMYVLVMLGSLAAPVAWGLTIAALLLFAVLLWHEIRSPEPIVPLHLMRLRVIGFSNAGNFVMGALAMGVTAFLPTYVQGAMGRSAIVAGTTLGVMSASWVAGAISAARLMLRATYRTLALVGGAFILTGSALLMTLRADGSVWFAIAGSALLGIGFGYINLVFTVATQASVGWAQRGAATASNIFTRQVGQAIGTAAFAAVFNTGLYVRLPDAGDVVTRMMEPAARSKIAAADVVTYAAAIAASLHVIYVILGVLGIVTVALTFGFPATLRSGDREETA